MTAAPRAVVFGCAGPRLEPREAAFFREADPWGFIVFARNVASPEQLSALTAALRECVGRDAPVLVDQEGGRVARLRAPHWREWRDVRPAFAGLALESAVEAARLRARIIGAELAACGVDVNCAPSLDLGGAATHPFLRDRTFGDDPERVAALGRATRAGLADAGVAPVIKHMPGHGGAHVDSHFATPRVSAAAATLRARDFAPFAANADCAMAMTGHVVVEALDPDRPATFSPIVIEAIRRDIGFTGLLLTDDLNMRALDGPVKARAARALAAGCDVALHCCGDFGEMEAVADAVGALSDAAAARAETALATRTPGAAVDVAAAAARHDALIAEAADA